MFKFPKFSIPVRNVTRGFAIPVRPVLSTMDKVGNGIKVATGACMLITAGFAVADAIEKYRNDRKIKKFQRKVAEEEAAGIGA